MWPIVILSVSILRLSQSACINMNAVEPQFIPLFYPSVRAHIPAQSNATFHHQSALPNETRWNNGHWREEYQRRLNSNPLHPIYIYNWSINVAFSNMTSMLWPRLFPSNILAPFHLSSDQSQSHKSLPKTSTHDPCPLWKSRLESISAINRSLCPMNPENV